ncbi:MAG TPA: rhodanese-like domain-containing protein [Thermoanaerobaculia bacterium]|nr:rhodanese-like domain-containing protein [Thermoanaerobaculia bacterium]
MAKQRHEQAQSSKAPIAMLAIGALLVAGLVVWALTRTVEPAATPAAAETAAVSTTAAAGTTAAPTETTPVTGTTAPIASATAPITATSTTPPSPPQGDRSAVQRISAEELRNKMSGGNVVIVDVRDANSYQASHIAGAIHVPMSSIQTNLDLIPKGKEIVTYCT